MATKKGKKGRPVQLDLFGEPIEDRRSARQGELIPCVFDNSVTLRAMTIKGEYWFVAADVCRGLEVENVTRALSRLDEDEKMTLQNLKGHPGSQGGARSLNLISEPGLYRLVASAHTKDKPGVVAFQRWLYHDVLPSLRKHGYYAVKPRSRQELEAKRLGCDPETAKVRVDQFETNKSIRATILASKGCVNDIINCHETAYREEFGMDARGLRKVLGLGPNQTPLDHMEMVPLSINQLAKGIAMKVIALSEQEGRPIPPAEHAKLFGTTVREIREQALEQIGPCATFTVVEDPRRGKVIDVARPSLN